MKILFAAICVSLLPISALSEGQDEEHVYELPAPKFGADIRSSGPAKGASASSSEEEEEHVYPSGAAPGQAAQIAVSNPVSLPQQSVSVNEDKIVGEHVYVTPAPNFQAIESTPIGRHPAPPEYRGEAVTNELPKVEAPKDVAPPKVAAPVKPRSLGLTVNNGRLPSNFRSERIRPVPDAAPGFPDPKPDASPGNPDPFPGNPPGLPRKVDVIKRGPVLSSYGLYSPAVLTNPTNNKKKLFLGGFASAVDPTEYHRQLDLGADPKTIWGPGKIYVGELTDNAHRNAGNLKLALAMKGYHVNDATLVRPQSDSSNDRRNWIYMYFTMLDNQLAENCRKAGKDLLQCPELFAGHDIGFASSVDEGETWTFRGIVVKASDAGDGQGAWMPAVVAVNDELHLYYNTGAAEYSTPNLFRQRFYANGHEKIGSPEKVNIAGFVPGSQLHNVDIFRFHDGKDYRFLLTGNNGGWSALPLYESSDGISFRLVAENIVFGDSEKLITPHIEEAYLNQVACPAVVGAECKTGPAPLYLKFFYTKQVADHHWETRFMEVNIAP